MLLYLALNLIEFDDRIYDGLSIKLNWIGLAGEKGEREESEMEWNEMEIYLIFPLV